MMSSLVVVLVLFQCMIVTVSSGQQQQRQSGAIAVTSCPFESDDNQGSIDPIEIANRAVHELLPMGHIAEALACNRYILRNIPASMAGEQWVASIKLNTKHLTSLLSPRDSSFPRIYHNFNKAKKEDSASGKPLHFLIV